MPFVAHDCRRKECNNRFLADDDGRHWIDRPPKTKYCPDCEALGYSNSVKDKRGIQGAKNLAAHRAKKLKTDSS